MSSHCLPVEDVAAKHRHLDAGTLSLPHFACLLVSPADCWSRNRHEFDADRAVGDTLERLMVS